MDKLKPCPFWGAKLKRKKLIRYGEIVFDHPDNGCIEEWTRVRSYKEAIEAWNRRADNG